MLSDKTKDRIFLIIEFVAFWFLLPDLFGEDILRKMEALIEKFGLGLTIGASSTASFEDFQNFVLSNSISSWEIMGVLFWYGLIVVIIYVFVRMFVDPIVEELRKESKHATFTPAPWWLFIVFGLSKIVVDIMPGLIHLLADDSAIRQRFMWVGAILGSLGIIFKFIMTFEKQKPELAPSETKTLVPDLPKKEKPQHKKRRSSK